jgi:hypothetical protein
MRKLLTGTIAAVSLAVPATASYAALNDPATDAQQKVETAQTSNENNNDPDNNDNWGLLGLTGLLGLFGLAGRKHKSEHTSGAYRATAGA